MYNVWRTFYSVHCTMHMVTVHCILPQDLMAAGSPVNLAGDGRYDSPGFNAALCTYYTMVCFSQQITEIKYLVSKIFRMIIFESCYFKVQ